MTRAGAAFPERPADVPGEVAVAQLAEALHQHRLRVIDARHGVGEPLPGRRVAGHALAALALSAALVDRLASTRWADVLVALVHGATTGQLALATGLDEGEVIAQIAGYVGAQVRLNERWPDAGMTPAEADEVRALLVAEPPRSASRSGPLGGAA